MMPSIRTSSRMRAMSVAVADPRTSSIIVGAARDLMPNIEEMVKELDANPGKKQKVYCYELSYADSDSVKTILQGMFTSSTSVQNNNSTTVNALTTRQQQNAQSTSSTSTTGLTSTSSQ